MDHNIPRVKISPAMSWIILFGIGATWGSSYFFIKKALLVFTPYEIGPIRIALTFICFLPWLFQSIRKISFKHLAPLLVVAFFGSGFPAFLFPYAQTGLSSSFTGIMSSTTPLFTIAIGVLFFQLRLGVWKLLGVLIGFLGTTFLVLNAGSGPLQGSPWFALTILVATSMYSISSNTINKYLVDLDTISISSIAFTILGIPALCYLYFSGTAHKLATIPGAWEAFGYLSALAFFGTFFATILFFNLIKSAGIVFSSTVSYIIPCMALILGFMDGETLNWIHFLGISIILTGIWLTNRKS